MPEAKRRTAGACDPEGRLLGQIDLPYRFTVYEIGSDYVLGRRVDELDVEHVELYGLNTGDRPLTEFES